MDVIFAQLVVRHLDSLVHVWAKRIYDDARTDLPSILSYRELVEFMPDLLEALARELEERRGTSEIRQAARSLRAYPQTRFQQGVLIDEMARELTLLREVLNRFLWRERPPANNMRELEASLLISNVFIDDLLHEAILVYAANMRPTVRTRASVWPPARSMRGRDRELVVSDGLKG
jgi:hypothetical protein